MMHSYPRVLLTEQLSEPTLQKMFNAAKTRYQKVFVLPEQNTFSVSFMKNEKEHVVHVRMVKRHYGLRIPKAIVQDKLEPDPGNADNTIWRVRGGCIAAVEYADYISIGITPDDEDEATFAQVLANRKDLEDDSDKEVPDFFNEYEAFAAVL
jgi:hypothetical protein